MCKRNHEIYRLCMVEKEPVSSLAKKFGLSRSGVYKILRTFGGINPQELFLMNRQKKENETDDTRDLLREISRLKQELAKERLRADFYEEMVELGKEVYGIDLKKAGTK